MLTSVGIVIVILAFSLQQSLQDLAAAVIFMLFKPFKIGDLIETKDTTGTVEDIGPFATTLVRWDGKVVVLPNSQIQESGIINYSTKDSLVTDFKSGSGSAMTSNAPAASSWRCWPTTHAPSPTQRPTSPCWRRTTAGCC